MKVKFHRMNATFVNLRQRLDLFYPKDVHRIYRLAPELITDEQ
jgi:hypothetical protein